MLQIKLTLNMEPGLSLTRIQAEVGNESDTIYDVRS